MKISEGGLMWKCKDLVSSTPGTVYSLPTLINVQIQICFPDVCVTSSVSSSSVTVMSDAVYLAVV